VLAPGGAGSAAAGMCAMLFAPLAKTNVRQCQSPWLVATWYPDSLRRTAVTTVSVCTGAEITCA